MKPTVQYSPLTRKLFDRYLNWSFKRSFDNVFCSGLSQLEGIQTPLLFVPNHVSWWDGFFLFEIQRRARPKARLYTIALEKTCIENPILPKMGVLPLRPEDPISFRSLLTFLQQIRTEQLPEELAVGFFPQGRITPSFLPDLNFRRGIEKIISVLSPVTLVPVGIHVEPMTGKKPTAILTVGTPKPCSSFGNAEAVQRSVQEALATIHGNLKANGERLPPVYEGWYP